MRAVFDSSLASWWLLPFVPWAVALFISDAHTSRLPNFLTLPAIPIAMGVPWADPGANNWALLGGLAWGAVAFTLPLLHPRLQAGGGDGKLALTTGTLAATATPLGALAAMGLSGLLQCLLQAKFKGRHARESPHGPAMLMATGAVVVASLILR